MTAPHQAEDLEYVQRTYQRLKKRLDDHVAREMVLDHLIADHHIPHRAAMLLVDEALGPPNPFPSEWAARQTDPDQYARFRRSTAAKAREMNLPNGVSFIFGFPHARRRKPGRGESEIQSVRFKKDNWTKARAKAWLKKHGFKYGKIE